MYFILYLRHGELFFFHRTSDKRENFYLFEWICKIMNSCKTHKAGYCWKISFAIIAGRLKHKCSAVIMTITEFQVAITYSLSHTDVETLIFSFPRVTGRIASIQLVG